MNCLFIKRQDNCVICMQCHKNGLINDDIKSLNQNNEPNLMICSQHHVFKYCKKNIIIEFVSLLFMQKQQQYSICLQCYGQGKIINSDIRCLQQHETTCHKGGFDDWTGHIVLMCSNGHIFKYEGNVNNLYKAERNNNFQIFQNNILKDKCEKFKDEIASLNEQVAILNDQNCQLLVENTNMREELNNLHTFIDNQLSVNNKYVCKPIIM